MRLRLTIFGFLFSFCVQGQYYFSGYVDPSDDPPSVYLSIVEDYRQLNGIYTDQIITKTTADSTGFFQFKGNLLDNNNRIYRIHSDYCSDLVNIGSSSGFCPNSSAVLFLANNKDTISLPYGFEKQIFCDVESNNPKATALIKIDSIKEEMRFAYSEYQSEANKKLNDKKWFSTLQDFSNTIDDPLAQLYTYAYLSDRSNDIYRYYIEDFKRNQYYQQLYDRLNSSYPGTPYALQYAKEFKADDYIINGSNSIEQSQENLGSKILLVVSLILNLILIYVFIKKKRRRTKQLLGALSKQEQAVLGFLLDDKSNKDIAEALFVSVSTIKSHTNSIYKKLEVNSREDVKRLFNK